MDPMQLLIQKCFAEPQFVQTMYDNIGPNFLQTLMDAGIPMDQPTAAELESYLTAQDTGQRKSTIFFFKATALTGPGYDYVFQSGTLPPPWSNTGLFETWVDNF